MGVDPPNVLPAGRSLSAAVHGPRSIGPWVIPFNRVVSLFLAQVLRYFLKIHMVGSVDMTQTQALGTMTRDYEATAASTRWIQLLLSFIVMMAISSPQYVWTLFVPSFQKTTGALLSDVQWTITFHDCVADVAFAGTGFSRRTTGTEFSDRAGRTDKRGRLDRLVLHFRRFRAFTPPTASCAAWVRASSISASSA